MPIFYINMTVRSRYVSTCVPSTAVNKHFGFQNKIATKPICIFGAELASQALREQRT